MEFCYYTIKSQKGTDLIVFDQIIYKNTKNSKNPNITYWKCRVGCRVYLTLQNNLLVSVGDQQEHNHGSNKTEIQILQFLWRLRMSIYEDPSQMLQKLYR